MKKLTVFKAVGLLASPLALAASSTSSQSVAPQATSASEVTTARDSRYKSIYAPSSIFVAGEQTGRQAQQQPTPPPTPTTPASGLKTYVGRTTSTPTSKAKRKAAHISGESA